MEGCAWLYVGRDAQHKDNSPERIFTQSLRESWYDKDNICSLNEIPRAPCSKLTYLAQNSGEEVLCDLIMSVHSRQTGLRLNILSCNSRSFDHRGMIIRTLTALLLVADHRIACSTTSFG
jgi:hypothetical protein